LASGTRINQPAPDSRVSEVQQDGEDESSYRFSSPGAHPGAGGLIGLLLIAAAGMIASVLMLRGALFHRAAAYVGMLAGAFDLAYCTAYVLLPMVDSERPALWFIPAAGLLLMIWHIMVGWRLYRLGRPQAKTLPKQA
jgi:hypothetical protein